MRALALLLLCIGVVSATWSNTNVERKIDISTSIARVLTTITAKNDGSGPAAEYLLAIPESNITHIGKFSVKVNKAEQPYEESKKEDGMVFYKVSLTSPVEAGKEMTIKIRSALVRTLRPLPPQVRQSEDHFVVYLDNAYFPTPYTTSRMITTVKLGSPNVKQHTKSPEPAKVSGETFTLGPYNNVKPLASEPLMVHYRNSRPFVTAHTLRRIIEVSMWGNLAVEEWYDIENMGAKLKGTFSRLDYQQSRMSPPSSFQSLTAKLQPGASDIYFRDDIGNISTSRILPNDEVVFTQRFPLFGGWKTRFYYGYNVPLAQHLEQDKDTVTLTFPYASPMRDIHIEDMTVEVVLPEGVVNPVVKVGGKAREFEVATRATYLDYTGRTVVILKDTNLACPDRNENIEVQFHFSTAEMVWEPIYITIGFFTFFVTVITASRLFGS